MPASSRSATVKLWPDAVEQATDHALFGWPPQDVAGPLVARGEARAESHAALEVELLEIPRDQLEVVVAELLNEHGAEPRQSARAGAIARRVGEIAAAGAGSR